MKKRREVILFIVGRSERVYGNIRKEAKTIIKKQKKKKEMVKQGKEKQGKTLLNKEGDTVGKGKRDSQKRKEELLRELFT